MALTRKFLSALGIDADKVDEIITAHSETVTALKEERDNYKKDAETLAQVQQELTNLKKNDFEAKYNKEHQDFEEYKKTVNEEKASANVRSAYKSLLDANGVGSRHIDSILKVTDFSKMEIGEDGKLKDEAKVIESIKNEWSGFIGKEETKGAGVDNPPGGGGKTMTKSEIMEIKDASERQKAIAENHELFGF